MIACLEHNTPASRQPRRSKKLRPSGLVAGSEAEEALVRQHLPLVKATVGKIVAHSTCQVHHDDLFSAGLVGLLNAARNFDEKSGVPFEAYARLRIRGAVLDELRRLDWVPRSIHDKNRKVQAVIQELEQARGETVGDAEVAKALNLSAEEYEDLQEEIRPVSFVNLDAPVITGTETDEHRHERVADPNQPDPVEEASHHELTGLLAERIKQLPTMQRKVMALYYFEEMRLREIAEAFGVTESRICQIHTQALQTLRTFLKRYEAVAV